MKMKVELFVSFEGLDKSGKTSQIFLLTNYLEERGYEVLKTCEPGGTDLGKRIKQILLCPSHKIDKVSELFLYLADRSEHVKKVIKPALKKGKIVISDRFADAGIAYQGYGREIDIGWIEELNKTATQGICPTVTFLLDINPHLARQRGNSRDRLENEKIDFHQRVRRGYLEIAKSFPKRIRVIKAEASSEEIFSIIKVELSRYL